MSSMSQEESPSRRAATRRPRSVPAFIGAGTLLALALGGGMVWRAEARTNRTTLAERARSVSVIAAKATRYQPSRSYVGTLFPWVEANVGPQLVSAYVETVDVRPGDRVRRGDVLATLDCRNARSSMATVALQAQALEESQRAIADQARRTAALLDGGFVSSNDVEQEQARSAVEGARLDAQKATLATRGLEVSDCVLRAPFDGEVGNRWIDPGAFVRPGTSIVSVIDRSRIRFVADVPEVDVAIVAPGTAVRLRLLSIGEDAEGTITRRSPSADAETRTIHFEVDLRDPERRIAVGTTGEASIDVGAPQVATEIPLLAATVRGSRATLFTVDGETAHAVTVPVLGERGGSLCLAPSLAPGALVVTEGRTLIHEGDRLDLAKALAAAGGAP